MRVVQCTVVYAPAGSARSSTNAWINRMIRATAYRMGIPPIISQQRGKQCRTKKFLSLIPGMRESSPPTTAV